MSRADRPGAVTLDTVVDVSAPAAELATLPFDFERYVAVEPRLDSARWIADEGPAVGSAALLELNIPFVVPLVGRLVGPLVVEAKVTRWDPPRGFSAIFVAPRFAGSADVKLDGRREGARVVVRGELTPTSALARRGLAPLEPLLRVLAARAVERGVRRASDAITSGLA